MTGSATLSTGTLSSRMVGLPVNAWARVSRPLSSTTSAASWNQKPPRPLRWGRLAVQLPENEYQRLLHQKPELRCWDQEVRSKAWDKWLQSEESRPYRVRERI